MWSTFAAVGTPNVQTGEDISWERVRFENDTISTSDFRCLRISDTVRMENLPEKDRMEFWKTMYTF